LADKVTEYHETTKYMHKFICIGLNYVDQSIYGVWANIAYVYKVTFARWCISFPGAGVYAAGAATVMR
jgi:hypothetical protein